MHIRLILGWMGVAALVGVMGACNSAVPEETIASLQAKVKEHPNDPVLNERLARMLVGAGREKEAIPYFQAAMAFAPLETSARCGLASVLFSQKQALEAQKLLEANLKMRPEDPASNEVMGDILVQTLGEIAPETAYPRAAHYFNVALQGDATRAVAALGLSKIFITQGKLSDAAGVLQKPLAAHPKNAALHLQMANILALAHRYDQASIHFDAGTALDPKNSEALCTWGIMLIDGGRPDTAERVLRRALELEPRNAKFHMHLARALRDEGNSINDAMNEFKAAIECDYKYCPVYVEIADYLLQVKDRDKANEALAEKFLRDAIHIDGGFVPAKIALARMLTAATEAAQRERNLFEAVDLLHQCVVTTKGEDLSLLVGYADALARVQEFGQAVEQIEKAIAWGKTQGLRSEQMDVLLGRRQAYLVAQVPEVEGNPELLELAVDGRRVHDPVDDPWPFPNQPPVKSLLLPMDLSHAPAAGTVLDPKNFTGEAVKQGGLP